MHVLFFQKPQEGHIKAKSLNGVICSDTGNGSSRGANVGMAAVHGPNVFTGKAREMPWQQKSLFY